MQKKIIIVIISLLVVVALYNSVYFDKLDTKSKRKDIKNFNPKEAVNFFWENKLDEILKSAIEINSFDSLLTTNPQYLIKQHGKSVGITSNFSFLVKGIAKSNGHTAGKIPIFLANHDRTYNLLLKNIFGNSARDAVGYFNVDDFENTMDFNAVTTELNTIILKEVVSNKFNALSPDTAIRFIGAVEINSENLPEEMEIIPLKLEIGK